jgi:Mg-chelatase subunit ChlD
MKHRLPTALTLCAVTLLACSHGALSARDGAKDGAREGASGEVWTSPSSREDMAEPRRWPKPRPPAPPQQPETPWPGMLWRGVDSGAPAAPSASHCRRAPQPFEIGAGPQWEQLSQQRFTGERRLEKSGGHARSPGAPGVMAESAAADAVMAAPTAPGAPGEITMSGTREAKRMASPSGVAPQTTMPTQHLPRPESEPVSAGVIDDNADFGEYLAYRQRKSFVGSQVRNRDISERYQLVVQDSRGRPVPDAQVSVNVEGRPLALWARTDAGGRAWLHPSAVESGARFMEVQVLDGASGSRGTAILQRGQKDRLQVVLRGAEPAKPQLDIAFLIDATGSMADEIDKLKRSMRAVADEINRLPSAPDVCYAMVAYRDRGDAFFVRGADFTNDLGAFQQQLAQLQANGGGDKPEALNEALHTAVHRLSWRGDGTARMVLLVADAMPHLDYGTPLHDPRSAPQYDHDAIAALAKGIKLFAVGASGLEPEGEYIFRQAAQYTGGRFVFLTYAQAHNPSSGPGRETVHDVKNYSVETLDKLIVRLVRDEMAGWPKG